MTQHIAVGRFTRFRRLGPVNAASALAAAACFRRTTSIRTAAAAVAAFVLFWPAILWPILEIEKMGIRQQSRILGGTIDVCR